MPASQHEKSGLTGAALYVGIGVIAAWLAMVIWLVFHIGDAEVQWSRLVFLLSSLEAVALGAAGALFGTHIQRQRVAEAQDRATKAEGEAAANIDAAVKGKSLAAAVKTEAEAAGRGFRRTSADPENPETGTVIRLADQLLGL